MFRALRFAIAAAAIAAAPLALASPAASIPALTSSISWTTGPTAQIGVYNWLSVALSSSDGTTRPSGGVQFFTTDGALMGQASTSPSGTAGATAAIPWIPTQEQTYSFTATFRSENTAMAGASTSVPITIQATPNGQWVQIAAPQIYQGIPATLTATNSPGTQGAAGQWVNVLPPLGTDTITLSPTLTTMTRYQKAQLLATTTAGAPVTLTATGGCTLVGDILTATKPSGTCVVTGTSPSTGGYLGTTQTWTIQLTPRSRG